MDIFAIPDAFDSIAVDAFTGALAPRVRALVDRAGISVSTLRFRVEHSAIIELVDARVASRDELSFRALYPEEEVVVQRAIVEQCGVARLSASAIRFVAADIPAHSRARAAADLYARLRG